MNLRLAFRLSTFLMAAAGHLALILTPEIPWPHALLLFALLLAAWLAETASFRLPVSFWNWSLSLLLVGCLVYGIWFAEFFFKAGIYFVAYLAAARLFQRHAPRDYWLLFLLTLMELCGASILTINLSFLGSLLLYLAAAVVTLILFNLLGEAERAEAHGQARRLLERPWINRAFLLSSTGLTLGLFAATLAIFFLIPRVSRTFFLWSTRAHPRLSGFSETVSLGEVGKIKLDPTPVMRVKIRGDSEPREGLLWRGNAMDYYDGYSWRDTLPYTVSYYPYGTTVQVRPASPLAEQVVQEIYLEPTESAVLFTLDRAEGLFFPRPFTFTIALLTHENDYYSLPLATPIYDRLLYHVYSRPPNYSAEKLRQAWEINNTQAVRDSYAPDLQLPPGSERIAALAREVAGKRSNPYDQVIALLRFLEENFSYSLDRVQTISENPLEDFLFGDRRGHCEYYASALAIMLRSLGVPCRMIAGFQRGAWNSFEHYYLVRQSDAHTWVEVFFPGLGWLPFDPTPSSSITYAQVPTLWTLLTDRVDALRYRWDRFVVDYSLLDQIRAFQRVQSRSFQVSNRLLHLPGRVALVLRAWLGLRRLPFFPILAAAAALLLLYWARARFRSRPAGKSPLSRSREVQAALALYRRLLRLLKRLKLKRGETETALEFADRAAARLPAAQGPVLAVTELYHRVRFGERPMAPSERARAEAALRQLKKMIAGA